MIAAHATHMAAILAVRMLPPVQALETARRFGRWFPLDVERARHDAGVLEPWGTCLTRAIAIASRLDGADVVVGGDVQRHDLAAHAWVEVEGRALRSWDRCGRVLASFGSGHRKADVVT